MKSVLSKEETFDNGECEIKHLFLKKNNSSKLLVVFSGFPPAGKKRSYNYVLKFRDLECNKLYILDEFGADERGSYYLGKDKDFFITKAVSQLIEQVASKHNISKNDIITAGSSKGGYASLYYAFKNGYGATVVGAPQTLLGDYLAHPVHRDILQYIAGGESSKDIEYLNNVLFDIVKSSEKIPNVYLNVSTGDHHYLSHVVPLTNLLEQSQIKYRLDLDEYEEHGDVGKYFPTFAQIIIKDELSN